MNSIAKIQEKLREKELDAILITDEKNQRYAAGFPFTDGYVLVSREKAWLLTDSRYIEAAENSVDSCVTVQMFDRQHSRLSLLIAALQEAKVSRLGAEELKKILQEQGSCQMTCQFCDAVYEFDGAQLQQLIDSLEAKK